MRTRTAKPSALGRSGRTITALGAGVLLATAGLASAASAAPKPVGPIDELVVVTPTTRATTTTTGRFTTPTRDLCKVKPQLCPPPPPPCVIDPPKQVETPELRRQVAPADDITVRTLTTRPHPTTTRPRPEPCKPPTTKPDPKVPPVRVTPKFTG